ncbi:hypothetical protein [Rhodanobacter sp. DHG33]|uniref:hypothetical protein n=1 Tax=Rhodanobacter sp. DHG33 TaxID=2775921 RepID=UPI0017847EAA|nr:hypothetical protein [Rhodanobacter sp. DHG33]MBD8899946.1 hypothetical protein [Rhodanobacter sp. DHG33]
MMLPSNRRPSIDQPPVDAPLPASPAAAAARAAPNPPHVDYDLQPLLVDGLAHYVAAEPDECFHVR